MSLIPFKSKVNSYSLKNVLFTCQETLDMRGGSFILILNLILRLFRKCNITMQLF